ncbi:MAG: hypothetical protein FIB01_08905 [Gemmatimonadetes bacterium]|nr:hypothetical protein [Gemmatimonadota bacterium]
MSNEVLTRALGAGRRRRYRRGAAALLLAGTALLVTNTGAHAQRRSDNRFSHEPHRNVTCVACHASNGAGLGPARVTEQQCQTCHHTGTVGAACTRCHQASELTRPLPTVQHFRLSTSTEPVARTLLLSHQQHGGVQCRACHDQPPRPGAKALPCGSCHEQHHRPDADCQACHKSSPGNAHGNASHLGCGGSACHLSTPVPAGTRTRQMCLACHADRAAHFPTGNCIECHALPGAPKDPGKH